MRTIVYLVIADCANGDDYYLLDSVWTSERKANKRCEKLNAIGKEELIDRYECSLYEVKPEIVRH